jgi:PTH2 family peptidyl-tRNA hydrolase
MSNPKQIIVMRKDLGMRKGKMIAQGAHASMKVLLDMMEWLDLGKEHGRDFEGVYNAELGLDTRTPKDKALYEWLTEPSRNDRVSGAGFKKVCVSVNSEEELLELYKKAQDGQIPCALITDSGATEFHGEPTNTCIAIGPDYPDKIDPITGHLKLL